MTLMHWAMFLIGISIGGLVGCLVAYKNNKDQTEILSDLNKFCTNYAQITDKQYQALDDHLTKRMEIFQNCVERLCDICSQMSNENVVYGRKITDLVEKDHTNKAEMIQTLTDLITEHEKINEERWSLIVDYIQSDEEDYCVTCRHNNENDVNTCLTCSEGALFNYEPERKETSHD